MKIKSPIYSMGLCISLLLLVMLLACKSEPSGEEIESTLLQARQMVRNPALDSLLKVNLDGLNCMAGQMVGKALVMAQDFTKESNNQILLTPFTPTDKSIRSPAYSDLGNRQLLLNVHEIVDFAKDNSLGGEKDLENIVLMVLLHELGHFSINVEGAFDAPRKKEGSLGERKLDTEPEYLTSIKRTELKADSLAASLCKANFNTKKMSCFHVASGVMLIVPGIQFMLLGKRSIERFGQGHLDINGQYQVSQAPLRDPGMTHPNLELRVAFMNYYLHPTPESKKIVDDFLYNREVEPVIRQQQAPYIFQGLEKKL
jgi:hypothetical protein